MIEDFNMKEDDAYIKACKLLIKHRQKEEMKEKIALERSIQLKAKLKNDILDFGYELEEINIQKSKDQNSSRLTR